MNSNNSSIEININMLKSGPLSKIQINSINLILGSLSAAFIGLNFISVGSKPAPFILLFTTVISSWLCHRLKFTSATSAICWGGFFAGTVNTAIAPEMGVPGWFIYPIAVILASIYLSRMQSLMMYLLCIVIALVMAIWHKTNGISTQATLPMVWFVAILGTCTMALAIGKEIRCNINSNYNRLIQANKTINTLLSTSHDLIWTINAQDFSLDIASESFAKIHEYYYHPSSLHGLSIEEIFPKDYTIWLNAFRKTIELGHNIENIEIGGKIYEHSIKLINNDSNFNFLSILSRDVTIKTNALNKLEEIAYYDDLTELPNRVHLRNLAKSAMASASRNMNQLAFFYIDLDNFKYINDSYGHKVGDDILRLVASSMRSAIRTEDNLGRIAGDEFLAILTNFKDIDEVKVACHRLINNVGNSIYEKNGIPSIKPSISIGVALFPQDAQNFNDLIDFADKALYAAKGTGGNSYHFYQQMNTSNQKKYQHLINLELN